jgi:formylglycine-generating enzyme required for sulfatase activity
MNCVTRDEARGYCRFAGGRLPTHLEWEYAAKGAGKREAPLYPWGDAPLTSAHANSNGADGWPDTSPVGSFPQGDTALGLKDMAGNVWEFVESNYYENLGMRSAEVRGGSFRMPGATQFRTAFRYSYAHDGSEDEVGFRCVLDDAPAGEPY